TDVTPGYQPGDFRPFPRDGAGWSPTDFWDGGSWNWSPDPAPWDNIGKTFVLPNGTNTFVSEEHWAIRRWASTANSTLRIDWLTGVEIARRNAPAAPPLPAWNSRATAARTTAQALAPELIDITPFKSALVSGVNVLAIQGLNRCIDDSDFLLAPEITATVLPP